MTARSPSAADPASPPGARQPPLDAGCDFEEVYQGLRAPVHRQVERLVGDHHEAEDLTQETFLRALERWPRVRDGFAVARWIRCIARNTAIDRWRRRARNRTVPLPDEDGLPDVRPPGVERLLPGLVEALERLPAPLGVTLSLYALDRFDTPEISRLTDTSPGNVKVRLHRARSLLDRDWLP